jgi:hypothetical protein
MMRRIQILGLLWWFCGAASAATVTVGIWTPIFKGIDLAGGQQEATVGGEFNHRVLCYRVDLFDPDVVLFTTPKCTNCGGYDTVAQNTSHFLEQYGLQVAINGGFYSSSAGPNDVPLGTPEDVRGMALSLGNLVSPADDPTRAATLLFTTNNQPTLVPNNTGVSTEGVYTAVSGDRVLLTNGVVAVVPIPNDRDPRTAIGVSQDRRYLYLLTLDGRQPGWSDGADWYNTALWLQRFGAHEGINVDGGGSTTSVMADCQGKAVRLNRSSFVAAYGRERIIGHNFGVYAPPLPSELKNLAVTPAQTTAVITWETEFEATSQVEYGPTAGYGLTTPLDTRPKRHHVATLAGLAQGSNYFFRALSVAVSTQAQHTQACQFATVAALNRTELFGLTKAWRYTTNNLDGINWKAPGYNDATWLGPGPGLLYVLENSAQVAPRNTQMPPTSGTSIPRTYYFRTHFDFTGNTAGRSLLFSNYLDDGAVFYLNGAEVFRLRMAAAPTVIANNSLPTGTPCVGTAQAGDAATICPDVFAVSGTSVTNLVQGDNVLAVEVHNATGTDLVFGSALTQVSAAQVLPQLSIWMEGEVATLFWNGEGFSLQQSTDLSAAAGWSDVPGAVRSPIVVTNAANTYFRLRN